MKKIYFAKKVLFSLFLTAGITALSAESFRVGKVHEVSVTQVPDSDVTAKLGINEALAIKLPQDQTVI